MRSNPTENLRNAPYSDLIVVLLRQFKRLLVERGITFTDAQAKVMAEGIANRSSDLPIDAAQLRNALSDIIEESIGVLGRWNLTFAQALATGMENIPGWESTADFLDLANEKSNAEIRIAAGSALAVAFGEMRYVRYLLDAIAHDPKIEDVDAVFAQRVLLFVSGVDGNSPDWLEQVKIWLERQ